MIVFFTIFLVVSLGFSQEPYAINYNVSNGLPSSTVYGLLEDSKGYLWASTDNGVVRFDGYQFTHYSTEDGLTDNEIFNLYEGKDGKIWFSTYNGIPCYYENENFYTIDMGNNLKYHSFLTGISEDEIGNILFSYHKGGLLALDKRGDSKWLEHLSTYSSWSFNGKFYLFDQTGIFEVSSSLKSRKLIIPLHEKTSFANPCHTKEGIYIGQGNSIVLLNLLDDSRRTYHLPKLSEVFAIDHSDGLIWCGTSNGLYVLDKKNGETVFHLLKGKTVSSFLNNESGHWVATLRNGFYHIPSLKTLLLTRKNSAFNQSVTTTFYHDSTIWMGYKDNKVGQYKNDKIEEIHLNKSSKEKINRIKLLDSNSLAIVGKSAIQVRSDQVRNFYYWCNDIASCNGFVFFGANQLFRIPSSIFNDKMVITNDAQPFEHVELFNQNKILDVRVIRLYVDDLNTLWICSKNGLYRYDAILDSCIKINLPGPATDVTDIVYDPIRLQYLIGTAFSGVYIMNEGNVVTAYTSKEGLSSNSITKLYIWDENHYLIGTKRGLDQVDLVGENEKITNINYSQGLPAFRINDFHLHKDTIFIATDEGLVYFDFKKKIPVKETPKLYIDAIRINNKLSSSDKLPNLSYDENQISFSFIGLSYLDRGNLTYRYRLLGQRDKWTYTTNRSVLYEYLPEGSYVFEIQAINSSDVRSPVQSIAFNIAIPFWKSGYFIGLVILLMIGSIYTITNWRIKQLNHKHQLENKILSQKNNMIEMEKGLYELEQKARQLQLNPHFIFNSLNTIKGYYYGKRVDEANLYIDNFSKILRMILEHDNTETALAKEVEILELYLILLQSRYQNFKYEIRIDPKISIDKTLIPTMMIQPSVENAIIHGIAPLNTSGLVKIDFSVKKDRLFCSITDNGVGRNHSQKSKSRFFSNKSKSLALEITNKRLRLLSRQAKVSYKMKIIDNFNDINEATGTTVIFELPLKYLKYD